MRAVTLTAVEVQAAIVRAAWDKLKEGCDMPEHLPVHVEDSLIMFEGRIAIGGSRVVFGALDAHHAWQVLQHMSKNPPKVAT